MAEKTVKGGCLCGAIGFEVQLPSKWCAHCHCTQCQRFHGAPLVTWAGFEVEQFNIVLGAEKLRWYASSAPAQRGFCGECGSSFLFRSTQWPGEIHIALTNITDDIDREPEGHVYYESRVDWLKLADDLPRKL